MGHSTTNSGAFRQRLAAFRDWELVAGRGDSLAMTEVARMIAVPTDEIAERRALQTAFMNSEVFRSLYEASAKGQALDTTRLAGRAVHDFGVAPSSKEKFVESFTESAVVAGLADMGEEGQIVLRPAEGEALPEAEGAYDPPTETTEANPAPVRAHRGLGARGAVPVVHQVWEIDGGTITFEISTAKPLPASAFVTVGEVVASLERLATSLSPDMADELVDEDSEN